MRFKRTRSDCKACPLHDRRRVWGEGPDDGPLREAFIGEAPGEQEDIKGRPFVGPAGGLLNSGLAQASTERFRTWVTNVVACRPPSNKLDGWEGQEALHCCKDGFEEELAYLQRRGLRVVVPLGGHALAALGVETHITKARGSVYTLDGRSFIAVPTLHPSFLLRGQQKQIPTWVADLTKAHDLARKPYAPPREDFNLFPTVETVEAFVERALAHHLPIAVDIETLGIRPDYAKIVVVGLADGPEHAISVPFLKQGGGDYWTRAEGVVVREALKRLFVGCPLVFQNALFDATVLKLNGYDLSDIADDVLIAHAAIHPELPHDLGYIVSIYGDTPYWKDTFRLREDVILKMPDEDLRRYNLRDAVVLHQVLPGLKEDLVETSTTHIYRGYSMPLIPVLRDMTIRGMGIDQQALKRWGRVLHKKAKTLEERLREDLHLSPSFNLDSDDHLRLLVYGVRSKQFSRALEALQEYDDPARKRPLRRDTQKYRDLLALKEVLDTTPRLWSSGGKVKHTDGGRVSVDAEALLSLQIAALARRDLIARFVRPTADHRREAALIDRTLAFLEVYASYTETTKLISTYTDFPTWADDRVHTGFMLHGTRTGRLASRNPNMQNQPLEARRIFKAREGYTFIEGDYSNLEPRILAYLAGDEVSIEVFESGANIHDANTLCLFPWITKDHENWKDARMAAKKYRLAMNYGGSLYSIYRKVCLEVPGLRLSFSQFKQADETYREAHAAETRWLAETGDEAVAKRELRNAFGRIRIFLGDDDEVRREGCNFPIQSTAADVIGPAMVAIHKAFKGWKGLRRPHLLLQVHDSLLVEAPLGQEHRVIAIMKREMERTIDLGGRRVSLPVEFKVGTCWGEMKGVKA